MPKFEVKSGRWGEGHQPGDIIELDDGAARVRLEIGDIVLAEPTPTPTPIEEEEPGDVEGESAAAEEVVPITKPKKTKK